MQTKADDHRDEKARAPDKDKWKQEAKLEAIRAFAQALDIDPMRLKIEKQKELQRDPTAEEEIGTIQNEIKKLRTGNSDPKKIIEEKRALFHKCVPCRYA